MRSTRVFAAFCLLCTTASAQKLPTFDAASIRLTAEDGVRFEGPRIQAAAPSSQATGRAASGAPAVSAAGLLRFTGKMNRRGHGRSRTGQSYPGQG